MAFFKHQLLSLKQQASEHIETIKQEIADSQLREVDELDRAHAEEDNRQRMRIVGGDYGYCEASGIEIGLQRLLARPTTELSTEEKALQEQLERSFAKDRN